MVVVLRAVRESSHDSSRANINGKRTFPGDRIEGNETARKHREKLSTLKPTAEARGGRMIGETSLQPSSRLVTLGAVTHPAV